MPPPRVLFSEADIAARVSALGRRLAADYAEKRPLVLGVRERERKERDGGGAADACCFFC
jgi:hypothetical protein